MDNVTEMRMLIGGRETRTATARSAVAASFDTPGLSIRESAILELIGQGLSNKRVARTLGISSETVKSHVKRVFIKLDVNTRAHAVARAQSLGLFRPKVVWPQNVPVAREIRNAAGA